MLSSDTPPISISPAKWDNWQWQMRHAITNIESLPPAFQLHSPALQKVVARYPFFITPYALSLLQPADPTYPLNLMALPHLAELLPESHCSADPFQEQGSAAFAPGVKQRFPDRILVMATDQCALRCRHCTRKNILHKTGLLRTVAQRRHVLTCIQAHPAIREVIISGGDPGVLTDHALLTLVNTFTQLEQIEVVRIGTRVLATLPMRITKTLCEKLGASGKVWVNTQFNHPHEITPAAAAACTRLVKAGIPVSNQSVLLRGVNDTVPTMFALCTQLQRIRVRPYYVFLCDPICGIAHLRVSLSRARAIERQLATLVGGLALPRFVQDLPGKPSKTII